MHKIVHKKIETMDKNIISDENMFFILKYLQKQEEVFIDFITFDVLY